MKKLSVSVAVLLMATLLNFSTLNAQAHGHLYISAVGTNPGDALTFDKQMSAPAHIMLREELRKPLDDARANKGIREYLQLRDGPFQPEPFGPKAKKKA